MITANNKVLQQQGNLVTIESDLQLHIGQVLLFDESVTGMVTKVDNLDCIVMLDSEQKVSRFRLKNWWRPLHPPAYQRKVSSLFFIPDDSVAVLEVMCFVPPDYVIGTIGWELLYQVNNPKAAPLMVACGHDYENGGICYFRQDNGLWPSGVYNLIAKRFNAVGMLTVAQTSKRWTLSSASSSLILTNSDNSQPLQLV